MSTILSTDSDSRFRILTLNFSRMPELPESILLRTTSGSFVWFWIDRVQLNYWHLVRFTIILTSFQTNFSTYTAKCRFPENVIFKLQYLRNALSDFKTVFSFVFSTKMSTKRICFKIPKIEILQSLPVTTGSDGRPAHIKIW